MTETRRRIRTCLGCRESADPSAWKRVAATKDGTLLVGATQPGRGAWICSPACFDRAVASKALGRALRQDITSADAESLRARLFEPPAPGPPASPAGERR